MASTDRPLKILVVASEVEGLVKTGGLADVARALPATLTALGHDVQVVTPAYSRTEPIWSHWPSQSLCVHLNLFDETWMAARTGSHEGLPLVQLEHAESFDRPGIYDDGRWPYPDNARRFGLLSKGALQWCKDNDWRPDIVHANDWQAALCCFYLKEHFKYDTFFDNTRSLLSLHNAAYQGQVPASWLQPLGIHEQFFHPGAFEDFGQINLLKGGIRFADALCAVSPGYADELVTDLGGHGLGALFRDRSDALVGILNGCDYGQWSPETDPMIPATYTTPDEPGKAECKRRLQQEMGFAERDVPLLVSVSRLTDQKGFHLLIPTLWEVLRERDIQIALLGSGDPQLAAHLHRLANHFPDKVAFVEGYDNALSHRMEAGGDAFLMPSIFEPCGLNQIYSLRYGTLPLVRAVGGLKDTVVPLSATQRNTRSATGFMFEEPSEAALRAEIERMVDVYERNPKLWLAMQRNAMKQRFEWESAAREYLKTYRRMLGENL
ncbi:glycogen synthase GlgA [Saccharospirillum salsuginis]|uniref:Glycogen synthase n=1 Tax=Saccharospirillum salsuginis TaxID=418750 RepID=A0A918N5A9_9GAMM|nr:glycogen synthase GlgA [Saccharospirillum salsuginis]GGX38366.1 glycogen synthase [Saccharospirillum salsuginis]